MDHKMDRKIMDIYDLTAFNEYDDVETIKFVIDKADNINIFVNNINFKHKPNKDFSDKKTHYDYYLEDILDKLERCINSSRVIIKIKTNMNNKMLCIDRGEYLASIIYNNKIFFSYPDIHIRFYKPIINRYFKENNTELYLELNIKNGPYNFNYISYDYTGISEDCSFGDIIYNYTYYIKIPQENYIEKPSKVSLKKINSYIIPVYEDAKITHQKHSLTLDYFHVNKNDVGYYILNSIKNEITGEIISIMQKSHCNCTERSYIKTSKTKDNTNIQDALSICICYMDRIRENKKIFKNLYINFADISKILKLKKSVSVELIHIYI